MSDYIVKIIPSDPYFCITEQQSQKIVQFNDLIYDFPCGFSRVEFAIMNPENDINDSLLSEIQSLLEITICVIHAHI